MIKVQRYVISLVGLSIIITLQQIIWSQNFRVLSFLLWISSLSLVINLIISGIHFFSDSNEDHKTTGSLLDKIFMASKIIIGFGLLLGAIVFCFDFIISKFKPLEYLNYKLFVPFGILFVIGRIFIKEKEVNEVIKNFIIKWTPVVKEWLVILEEKFNVAWQWAISRKWLVGSIGLILLLLFTLPTLLKAPEEKPKLITLHVLDKDYLEVDKDSVIIGRDYDQRVHLKVNNLESTGKNVFFEVIQEPGKDSLMLGFVGRGSHYEDEFKTQLISPGNFRFFDLLIHSAQTKKLKHTLLVRLYEADSIDTKGTRMIEEKELTVNINQGELKIEFIKTNEEPFSLAQTYQVKNNGSLISDFSLIPDSIFEKRVHIHPRITNFRFEENTSLTFTIEPNLYLGFKKAHGKLFGVSGMSQEPKELALEFNAPIGKSLYLGVSDCGSNSTTRVCECTNQRRTVVEVTTPSENHGPFVPPDRDRGRPPVISGLDPPVTLPPPEDPVEPPEDSEPPDDPVPAVEPFDPYSNEHANKEEILRDAEALKANLEAAKEEFDDAGISGRIDGALEQIDAIIKYVTEEEKLSEETIDQVNIDMPKPYEVFDEVVGHQGNNRARERANAAMNGEAGLINLRVDGKVASLNNAAVPTIYFSENHSHFAWHEPPRYEGDKQRVYYSRHHINGPVEISQREMNLPASSGRWPMVIEGNKNKLFYVWQGKSGTSKYDVLFRKSNDNGKNWSKTYKITNHGKGVYAPRLSFYNNNLYVYWIDYSGEGSKLYVSLSTNDGETFSNPVEISGVINYKGVLKMVQNGDQVFFFYEVKYTNGKSYIICQRVMRQAIHDGSGSDFNTDKRVLPEGSQPAGIVDKNNQLHIAYVNKVNNSYGVHYFAVDASRLLTEDITTLTFKTFSEPTSYSLSPSLLLHGDNLNLIYHLGKKHHGQFIDHLRKEKMNINTKVWSQDVHRFPSLSPNSERTYLSVQFDLPWSRSIYDKHDVKILLNNWTVAHLEKTIPEGKMLFPIPSHFLKYDGDRVNKVTLETVGFNPAAYLATSEIKLISDLSFMEQFVFAASLEEADKLLYSRKEYNHAQPDLGLYSTVKTAISDSIVDGHIINLNLDVWNLGQGSSTESRIDIFGATFDVDNRNLKDRNLLKQIKRDTIAPFEKISLKIPVMYWAGLEKIVVKVTSKEKDFDLSNNTFTTVLVNPKDNLHVPTYQSSMLRVAVYDAPGILAENVYFELVNPDSSVPEHRSDTNPAFWRPEVGIYNLHMRSKNDDRFEQWISGIPITVAFDEYGNMRPASNLSLDIQLKDQDKMLESLDATKSGSNINFELPSELLFEVNEAQINLYAFEFLKKIIYLMNTYPNSTILVEGHTDAQGDPNNNLVLSKRRAQTVADWLIQTGNLTSERFQVIGAGASKPVATNDTKAGRSKNRRVTFNLSLNE